MRVPDVGTGAERLHGFYGLYHLSRLRADEEMADLVRLFEQAQDALRARLEEAEETRVAAMTALAVRDARDDELDDAVREFYFELLRMVVNNRTDPLYLRYFPEGMSAVIGLPHEEEVRAVGILLTKLDEGPNPELKPHAGAIQKAVDSLSVALEAYEVAVDGQRLAGQKVQEEKLRWIDAYSLSYREVQRRFYKDVKKAERYFRSARRSSRAGEEEEDVEEEMVEMEPAADPIVAERGEEGA